MLARGTCAALALAVALLAPSAWAAYEDGPAGLAPFSRAAPVAPGRAGELLVVPGRSRILGRGRSVRVAVEVEGGLRLDRGGFARRIIRILADRRGWGLAVRRVSPRRADFRVVLARPALTDRLCAPLATYGHFSCAQGRRAVLNVARWRRGAVSYRGDLRRYRIYLVNHEVGHLLGHGHVGCPGVGHPAPVMMQQTKGLGGCRANPWPLGWEG